MAQAAIERIGSTQQGVDTGERPIGFGRALVSRVASSYRRSQQRAQLGRVASQAEVGRATGVKI